MNKITFIFCFRVPLATDITEFNNGPPDETFRGLGFAFQRSLLNVASALITLEHNLFNGQRSYGSQQLGVTFGRIYDNRQYNTSQNRSNVRDTRLFSDPKLFVTMVSNALRRCTDRHELWLNFIINCVPYLDRMLSTFSASVVDQLCRNIYACMSANFAGLPGLSADYEQYDPILSDPPTPSTPFDDYRQLKKDFDSELVPSTFNDYPANYSIGLFDTLTTIVHYCLIETTPSAIPFLLMRTSFVSNSLNSQPAYHNSYSNSTLQSKHHETSPGISLNMSSMVGSALSVIPGTRGASEFVGNLFGKVFTSTDNAASSNNQTTKTVVGDRKSAEWNAARLELTKKFPAVFAIISDAWYFSSYNIQPRTPIGEPRAICHLILTLLGPIAKSKPQVFTSSAAIVWSTRGGRPTTKKESDQVTFNYTCYQKVLAQLCLKVLSFAELLNACLDLLKDPSAIKNTASNNVQTVTLNYRSQSREIQLPTPIMEVSLLELLHCCMQCLPATEIRSAWAALNVLFSEVNPMSISPRGCFLMFIILSDFVKLCGAQAIIEDRSISRGCQEACQRITEALNQIVGWQLETTTWLKRTLVVKQDNQKLSDISPTMDYRPVQNSLTSEANSIKGSRSSLATESNRLSMGTVPDASQMTGSVAQLSTMTNDSKKSVSSSNVRSSLKDPNNNRKDPANSTQALFLLAENLTELIDSICKSEDKEKLLPTLQAVWNNTLPYLKAKSARNVRFFLASSQFLASLSSYNYMRAVWKKTTMDLLLDSSFFKMDIHALKHWLVVIDNLMATNDRTAFKELLTKLPSGTSTALSNLMTSKEQEYELRAQALKRLALVILSSELDQYYSNLPEIQEKLSDNLRLNQVPIVNAQIFVCCRVLLLRMRPNNFAVIWPSMVTELVQVLTQIEQHLQSATTDELRSPRDEQLLNLFLSACKFLETLCTLPSGYCVHGRLYHPSKVDPNFELFIPFATRLDALLTQKFGALTENDKEVVSASLNNVKSLSAIQELHPFFHALASQHQTKAAAVTGTTNRNELRDASFLNGTLSLNQAIQRLEQGLYVGKLV
ncbi:hypothetical protein M3Y97_00337000 [Aphelenchoides bicaudatus]|nr:hypothetical protein M3Y97_00337000 [Aphelenchoides bicaudatus]